MLINYFKLQHKLQELTYPELKVCNSSYIPWNGQPVQELSCKTVAVQGGGFFCFILFYCFIYKGDCFQPGISSAKMHLSALQLSDMCLGTYKGTSKDTLS